MKQNNVEKVQKLLAEKGIKVAESAIIDVTMGLILNSSRWSDEVEEKFIQMRVEIEYLLYQKAKESGRRDNI